MLRRILKKSLFLRKVRLSSISKKSELRRLFSNQQEFDLNDFIISIDEEEKVEKKEDGGDFDFGNLFEDFNEVEKEDSHVVAMTKILESDVLEELKEDPFFAENFKFVEIDRLDEDEENKLMEKLKKLEKGDTLMGDFEKNFEIFRLRKDLGMMKKDEFIRLIIEFVKKENFVFNSSVERFIESNFYGFYEQDDKFMNRLTLLVRKELDVLEEEERDEFLYKVLKIMTELNVEELGKFVKKIFADGSCDIAKVLELSYRKETLDYVLTPSLAEFVLKKATGVTIEGIIAIKLYIRYLEFYEDDYKLLKKNKAKLSRQLRATQEELGIVEADEVDVLFKMFRYIIEQNMMDVYLNKTLEKFLKVQIKRSSELNQLKAQSFILEHNIPMPGRRSLETHATGYLSNSELNKYFHVFQSDESIYHIGHLRDIADRIFDIIEESENIKRKLEILSYIPNLGYFFKRQDRLSLSGLTLHILDQGETDIEDLATICLIFNFYTYPLDQSSRDSRRENFLKHLQKTLESDHQEEILSVLEKGTFKAYREFIQSGEGSALAKIGFFLLEHTKTDSPLIQLLPNCFRYFNDYDFIKSICLVYHFKTDKVRDDFLKELKIRFRNGLNFSLVTNMIKNLRRAQKTAHINETFDDFHAEFEAQIFNYFEVQIVKLTNTDNLKVKRRSGVDGYRLSELFCKENLYRKKNYYYSDKEIQVRHSDKYAQKAEGRRYISVHDLCQLSQFYGFKNQRISRFWNSVEYLLTSFLKTEKQFQLSLEQIMFLVSSFSRTRMGSYQFWDLIEQTLRHKFETKIFKSEYNNMISIMNSFSHSRKGSNELWAEFEGFSRFFCENMSPSRALAALSGLVRRGRVVDVKWLNSYVSQILSKETNYNSKMALLKAAKANSLRLENLTLLVSRMEQEAETISPEEQEELKELVDKRYDMYNKFSTKR